VFAAWRARVKQDEKIPIFGVAATARFSCPGLFPLLTPAALRVI
jgi:hypothetical protein